MTREKVEKYIESNLSKVKGVSSIYVEKKNRDSVNVIVVTSKLSKASSAKILRLETKVNRDFKIPSEFKIFPLESWN